MGYSMRNQKFAEVFSEVEQDCLESLNLVKSRAELISLFSVDIYPILLGTDVITNKKINEQRIELYHSQYERARQLYLATESIRPTYLVQSLKSQFEEYDYFNMSVGLDKRGKIDISNLLRMWEQLHIVDDIIIDLVQQMPRHKAVGWQISSQARNYLKLPTVGRLRVGESIADQTSLPSYVLGHFGVMSYTYDKGFYIGHVLGYLFICYYLSYLSINYGVSALPEKTVNNFEYVTLKTPHLVRLLQTLNAESKKRVYQLAIICARLSSYATDKRIERLLVAEVNDFNKKDQRHDLERWLSDGIMPLPKMNENGLE